MTSPRSSQSFCARPGCTFALATHNLLAKSCPGFVEPGSKEARELTKVVDTSDLRSNTIDRAQLVARDKAQWAAIRKAKVLLLLALDADPTMFKIHCTAALMVLRGIGDS